jgi:hypothetical protein
MLDPKYIRFKFRMTNGQYVYIWETDFEKARSILLEYRFDRDSPQTFRKHDIKWWTAE